jgi:hypothetical protein
VLLVTNSFKASCFSEYVNNAWKLKKRDRNNIVLSPGVESRLREEEMFMDKHSSY